MTLSELLNIIIYSVKIFFWKLLLDLNPHYMHNLVTMASPYTMPSRSLLLTQGDAMDQS